MKLNITGRNCELSPALREYLLDKLQRAERHFDQPLEATALLRVAKNPSIANSNTVEVTLKVFGTTIRGEESSENMYASIDAVADKIDRQLRKFKTRYYSHHDSHEKKAPTKTGGKEDSVDVSAEDDSDAAVRHALTIDEIKPKIVRSKKFPLKPMTAAEAAAHMDLLGHDFFMFINSDTGNVNTVYHRRDGNYGLIEPDI